ncbi:MAG TPA: DUF5664 domain-containing protein [Candidatus Omnitrophota bacterium]|nr:DUF5664 domain-containing protein [Candidatus Omnitrophota bacterium]
MEIKNIYVEHDSEWYDYSHGASEIISGVWTLDSLVKAPTQPNAASVKTDKRDFEIGARVYFENVGWTEKILLNDGDGLNLGYCVFSQGLNRNCISVCKSQVLCGMGCIFKKFDLSEKQEEPKPENFEESGLKFDSGKLRPGLFPVECFEAISKVLTFGANKYSANNWKKVAPDRYIDALWRHYIAWQTGEKNDSESGLSHTAHFATNAVFLLYFELEKQKSEGDK